jgi:hypothetical protein
VPFTTFALWKSSKESFDQLFVVFWRAGLAGKTGGKVDLRAPTPYEIGEMIRLPAEAVGLHFEEEPRTGQHLDEALRDSAAATPELLPLLEHVLSLLYDVQSIRGDNLLRWSDYRELGELKGALGQHAETVFGTLR